MQNFIEGVVCHLQLSWSQWTNRRLEDGRGNRTYIRLSDANDKSRSLLCSVAEDEGTINVMIFSSAAK